MILEVFTVEGVVQSGQHLGRELGFPTANIAVDPSFEAQDGVYHTRVCVDGRWYDAMSNLGRNPSVGGVQRRLESHIFDFDGDLYGQWLQVELLERIRSERRFDSIEQLKEQLQKDKKSIVEKICANLG